MDAVSWLLSLWWGWLSLDAANCPCVLYVSVADAVLKSSVGIFWLHASVKCLSHSWCIFVSCLLPWGDFFLSRLETFSRLWICTGYFRPPRPDVFLLQSVFSVHRAPSPQPGGVEQPGCPPERSTGWGLPWTGPVGPNGWIWRYREVNFLIGVLWFGSTDPGVSCCFCLQEGRGSHCQMCLACAELWSGHERRQPGVTCSCQEMGIAY